MIMHKCTHFALGISTFAGSACRHLAVHFHVPLGSILKRDLGQKHKVLLVLVCSVRNIASHIQDSDKD